MRGERYLEYIKSGIVKAAENTLGMNQLCPEKERFDEGCKEAIKNRNLVYILWVKQPNRIKKQKLGNLNNLTNYKQKGILYMRDKITHTGEEFKSHNTYTAYK